MKITAIDDLHCDGGWRTLSFLKVSTDDGITGWSEYNECYGSAGLTAVIQRHARTLLGRDPRPVARLSLELAGRTRQAPGGVNQQAIAALENALLDIKAKALGVPVYDLFGGACRDTLPVYWSHCGTYRTQHSAIMGCEPLHSLDDVKTLGAEVAARGYKALKTNVLHFGAAPLETASPEVNIGPVAVSAITDMMAAFRAGAGPGMELMLDLNFRFKTEGYIRVARALESARLAWLELDTFDPDALATIRRSVPMPVASCESLYGRHAYKPFLQAQAADVVIVDVAWNGLIESLKIASMAETFEVNVAPHNFYSHLSSFISAHFCAAIPNFRLMEIEADDVPWKDSLVTAIPTVQDGALRVPTAPGWGADVNEDALREHPPKPH